MFKVKILSPGRHKENWLNEALREYEKRLRSTLTIEWLFPTDLEAACRKEPFWIALDPKGELLSSEAWSHKLHTLLIQHHSRLSFVIGGADGLPPTLQPPWTWSLSPLTFTHQMTRLLLIEQLYRAIEIGKNSKYHK